MFKIFIIFATSCDAKVLIDVWRAGRHIYKRRYFALCV